MPHVLSVAALVVAFATSACHPTPRAEVRADVVDAVADPTLVDATDGPVADIASVVLDAGPRVDVVALKGPFATLGDACAHLPPLDGAKVDACTTARVATAVGSSFRAAAWVDVDIIGAPFVDSEFPDPEPSTDVALTIWKASKLTFVAVEDAAGWWLSPELSGDFDVHFNALGATHDRWDLTLVTKSIEVAHPRTGPGSALVATARTRADVCACCVGGPDGFMPDYCKGAVPSPKYGLDAWMSFATTDRGPLCAVVRSWGAWTSAPGKTPLGVTWTKDEEVTWTGGFAKDRETRTRVLRWQ
jgi:hypothetical protein